MPPNIFTQYQEVAFSSKKTSGMKTAGFFENHLITAQLIGHEHRTSDVTRKWGFGALNPRRRMDSIDAFPQTPQLEAAKKFRRIDIESQLAATISTSTRLFLPVFSFNTVRIFLIGRLCR